MRKLAIIALLAVVAASCENTTSGVAYGDANSIIAVMSPFLWEKVQDDVYQALEPTIKTVRSEKTFNVTYQDPSDQHWNDLRRFRQLLLVGSGDEDWMKPALAKAREDVNGPGIYHAYDVWAVNQQVTVIVVTAGNEEPELKSHLDEVNEILDEQYREWAKNRMYMTGVDSALADTLMQQAHFEVLLPKVYRWTHKDSVYSFRNDNPDPSELIRQVTVTWKSPVPEGFQPEDILEWRHQISQGFNEPQDVDLSNSDAGPTQFNGKQAYQIQAIWKNPPELNWPAAGPFITRAIICPQQNRMYLLDSWLYAPGKDKYEYMIQLQTILDSFRCGAS